MSYLNLEILTCNLTGMVGADSLNNKDCKERCASSGQNGAELGRLCYVEGGRIHSDEGERHWWLIAGYDEVGKRGQLRQIGDP